MSSTPHLKSALSGALGATLVLLLLSGLLGASGGKGFKRKILARLDAMDVRLAELQGATAEPAEIFGLQLCMKGGLSGEGGFAGEQALKLEGQGRIGGEAFGNGLMAQLRAIPGAKVGGGVKGEAGGELTACFDLRALVRRVQEGTLPFPLNPAEQQMVTRLASADESVLLEKLLIFAAATSLDPTSLQTALDEIPNLAADVDPMKMSEPGNLATRLAQVVPLSFQARARLQDVSATFDTFERQRGLCSAQLPPALDGVVGRACQAAADEPLETLLEATGSATAEIRSRVVSVQSSVASLPSRVVSALCGVLPGC